MKPRRLVEVYWHDIEHDSHGWREIAEVLAEPPGDYLAVGYVLRLDRRELVLASVLSANRLSSFCTYRIPRGAIRVIQDLLRS